MAYKLGQLVRVMGAWGGCITCTKVSMRGRRAWFTLDDFFRESVGKGKDKRLNVCLEGKGEKDSRVAANKEEGKVSVVLV